MKTDLITKTIEIIAQSFLSQSLIKIKLSGGQNQTLEYSDISIKPVSIKQGEVLQLVYNYGTKNITKNYQLAELKPVLANELEAFANVSIITEAYNYQYNDSKGKLFQSKNKQTNTTKSNQNKSQNRSHNRVKNYVIDPSSAYLKHLEITNHSGNVKSGKGDKLKQINRYVEIMSGLIAEAKLSDTIELVDMGSGKGYLTFALYDYLSKKLGEGVRMTGVELRPDLVEKSRRFAEQCDFEKLDFVEGAIQNYSQEKLDVLIALHACDTATDDAIAVGINSGAKLIVCSPCCHKQIRQQMKSQIKLQSLINFGIMKERQAELITDTIRSLILELHGYTTKIMEFISTEHTAKNLLIVALKKESPVDKHKKRNAIKLLKDEFGIEYHYLEKTLKLNI